MDNVNSLLVYLRQLGVYTCPKLRCMYLLVRTAFLHLLLEIGF